MVASPEKGGAEKYTEWSLEQLRDECKRRNISYKDHFDRTDLINLLIKDDIKPTDWAKIYSRLLYHTGIHYEEISRRTLPQINALLEEAGENISIKIGMPNIFGGFVHQSSPPPNADQPPKISQFAALANMFSFIK